MTQPILFAAEDGEHCAVAAGGGVIIADQAASASGHAMRNYAQEAVNGKIAELRCCEQLVLRGWRYTLLGDGHRGYDIIAEKSGLQLQRIQVKCGSLRVRRTTQHYNITNATHGGVYACDAYDVLAFYMHDRDQWLLYHRCELGNRVMTSWTPPEIRTKAAPHTAPNARDPDNWELLDEVAATNSLQSLTPKTADVPPPSIQMSSIP